MNESHFLSRPDSLAVLRGNQAAMLMPSHQKEQGRTATAKKWTKKWRLFACALCLCQIGKTSHATVYMTYSSRELVCCIYAARLNHEKQTVLIPVYSRGCHFHRLCHLVVYGSLPAPRLLFIGDHADHSHSTFEFVRTSCVDPTIYADLGANTINCSPTTTSVAPGLETEHDDGRGKKFRAYPLLPTAVIPAT